MRRALLPLLLLIAAFSATPALAQAGNARALAIARGSPVAQAAMRLLTRTAGSIRSPQLHRVALAVLANPAPTFMANLATPEARQKVRQALIAQGLLDPGVSVETLFPPLGDPKVAPQPFLGAPANGLHGHHAYPGGLAQHSAFNLRSALDLAANYEKLYALPEGTLDRDRLIAAVVMHDAMKVWTLQWNADGTTRAQFQIAHTASHHPFMVAEALHRGLPPALVVTLASAHDDPLGDTAQKVVGYLRAGAILAGVDPVAYGLLVADGSGFALAHPAPMEAVINHLSDHDWVLTEPAAHVTDGALDRLAQAAAGHPLPSAQLNWMRYRIEAQLSGVALYALWSKGGDEAVRTAVAAKKLKWVNRADLPDAKQTQH